DFLMFSWVRAGSFFIYKTNLVSVKSTCKTFKTPMTITAYNNIFGQSIFWQKLCVVVSSNTLFSVFCNTIKSFKALFCFTIIVLVKEERGATNEQIMAPRKYQRLRM